MQTKSWPKRKADLSQDNWRRLIKHRCQIDRRRYIKIHRIKSCQNVTHVNQIQPNPKCHETAMFQREVQKVDFNQQTHRNQFIIVLWIIINNLIWSNNMNRKWVGLLSKLKILLRITTLRYHHRRWEMWSRSIKNISYIPAPKSQVLHHTHRKNIKIRTNKEQTKRPTLTIKETKQV